MEDSVRTRSSDVDVPSFLGLNDAQEYLLIWLEQFHFQAKKIDVISRILFPTAFVFFTGIYWIYYTKINKG